MRGSCVWHKHFIFNQKHQHRNFSKQKLTIETKPICHAEKSNPCTKKFIQAAFVS